MKDKKVTIKELIFSLREEYKKQKYYLNMLKMLTTCKEHSIKDFYYTIKGNIDNYEIYCNVLENKWHVRNILKYLNKEKSAKETIKLHKIENGYLIPFGNYLISIYLSNMEEFNRNVNKIVQSDLFLNVGNYEIKPFYLIITPLDLTISKEKQVLKYDSVKDQIALQNVKEYKNIKKLFALEINYNYLTLYLKKLINNL